MDQEFEESGIDLTEYLYVLDKHKWAIILWVILALAVTGYRTFNTRPIYQASTTMVIDSEKTPSPLGGEMVNYTNYYSQMTSFKTHLELITSRPVIEKVIRDLRLDEVAPRAREDLQAGSTNPIKSLIAKYKKNLSLLFFGKQKAPTEEERHLGLIQMIRGKVSIREIKDTRLVQINVRDLNPEMARDIANALTRAYIEFNTANRLEYSQNTLTWMTQQLYEVQKKLEDAETAFLDYKKNEQIFSVEGRQGIISQKINEFNTAYLETRNSRLELEIKLEQLEKLNRKQGGGDMAHVRSLIENPLIDQLYSQLIEAEVAYSQAAKIYKEKHPKLVQIRSKVMDTRRKLSAEISKEIESMKAQRTVLLSREERLQKTMADFENEALDTNRKELDYMMLQRNVETNKKLYDTLLTKLKESNVSSNQDVSNIRVTEPATAPLGPISPNKRRNMLMGLMVGLMLGVGYAFLRNYLDQTFRTEEDVQRYLDLPVLSVIPSAEKF